MVNLHKNNTYVVYRLTEGSQTDKRVLHLLWQGMATRLARIQNENPPPVSLNYLRGSAQDEAKIKQLYDAASKAHIRRATALSRYEKAKGSVIGRNTDGHQQTGYSFPVMIGHALPTVIPDNLVGDSNDQKYMSFIAGERYGIKDICSGFAATMLQAWSILCGHGRVFTDPASIHPTGLEHHLESGHLKGWTRVGTWGRGEAHGH
jgi:hypothetical protein